MLTRRHIRVKVMQCIYALTKSKDETYTEQEVFLKASIENTYHLYLLMLSLFRELHLLASRHVQHAEKKYVATASDAYPNSEKFVNNKLLLQIVDNASLLDELQRRKLKNWYLNEEYIKIVYKEIAASSMYHKYMLKGPASYEEDKNFLIALFTEVVAPNDKIYEYLEDYTITWVDDIPLVNTFIVKQFRKIRPGQHEKFFLPKLVKDEGDLSFAKDLLVKTLVNNDAFVKEIELKTPNWDKDRIADIDAILLKMAICELINFPSIPERVTINEYLEVAKEYSTPKSSIFINGILDKLVREYKSEGKLKKTGRGLL